MIARDDIRGEARPHEVLVKYLAAKGGKNPYGEPNFRLVWAPQRIRRKGGRFQDWDDRDSLEARSGQIRLASGLIVPSGAKPLRVVEEVRECRAYVFDAGWIMERWIAPHFYGTQGDWYAKVLPGTSLPLLGPYPEHGDYEMAHYNPTEEMPTISELGRAIDICERGREQHREQTAQVLLERENEYLWAYEQQMQREEEASARFLLDMLKPLTSGSLGMGRHRTMLAERAGIREHVGN